MEEDERQKIREQGRERQSMTAHEIGLQSQTQTVSERKQNPEFYEKFTRSSLEDTERWRDLVDEVAPWLADDHIISNRREVYRIEQQLLNKIRGDQFIIGRSPGARLREKPLLNELAQGIHREMDETIPLTAAGQQSLDPPLDERYRAPITPEAKATIDDLAEVATARQAMGVNRSGSESLTTATTETRTVHNDDKDSRRKLGALSGVFD